MSQPPLTQRLLSAFRKPVIVNLMGGLGNQMFQYATARSLAIRLESELFLDNSSYRKDKLRHYELDVFNIRSRVLPEKSFLFRPPSVFQETSMRFDERFEQIQTGARLMGYFQSEKYFCSESAQIRKDFTLKNELSQHSSNLKKQIQLSKCPVSLHVRRGDYATNAHTNSYHGLTPMQYYQQAVEMIKKVHPELHLFLFSDDPAWVSANMDLGVPQTLMQANPPDRGFEDMQLMSLCQHHIIANSSFSWWGAWLANRENQIVIAPKVWFLTNEVDDSDLVPEKWIRI